jgi:hypothetical protein
LDEVKIMKSFLNPSTNRNFQPDNIWTYPREPPIHKESQPDIVQLPLELCPDFESWPNG